MSNRLRAAVVGVGHLGRHHARILAGIEGVELVAVADARREQAEAVAAPLGAEAVVDYRSLLDRVDLVSVAVPTSLHRAVAGAFLERGVATLVEKPLAASLAEAEALVAIARRTGALLQVGHIERYNPAIEAVAASGLRPKFLRAERQGLYTFRSTDVGVVLDLMIHDIDLVLSLVPTPVKTVGAVGVSLFGGHEDVADARVEFEDGCVAHLTASRAARDPRRQMHVWAAEGYASLDFATRQATVITPSEALRAGRLDLDELDLSQPVQVKERLFSSGRVFRVDEVPAPPPREPLALELEDFVRAARTGSRPRVTGEDGLRAMRLADRILASLNAHAWEGRPDGPIGPRLQVPAEGAGIRHLPAPKVWTRRAARKDVPQD
jgi:predicted dehydrogenase